LFRLVPVIVGAAAFSLSDIAGKLAFNDGSDVLTMVTFRGVMGIPLLYAWLLVSGPRPQATFEAMLISLGLGVLFAGNVFLLYYAIAVIEVPVAVLTYFIYPLLTGIAGALTGIEKLGWKGAAAALVAFLGLGLMIGAHPGGLAVMGVVAALAAALCRVVTMLAMRAKLAHTDARTSTWYSLLSSTAVLVAVSLATWNWVPPHTMLGWIAYILVSGSTTLALLMIFVSTVRIGPFRTALFMNLEPLLSTVGSAIFLGEVITPVQAVGGGVMIAALVAFQLRR
jgi:drug/metabolite transporter (DMT)-like permease